MELGIADRDRIGVIGHSYGGYTVYSLVTQTDAFAAAVALAGFTNLVSLYGAIQAQARYSIRRFSYLVHATWAESSFYRMGSPPNDCPP